MRDREGDKVGLETSIHAKKVSTEKYNELCMTEYITNSTSIEMHLSGDEQGTQQ